MEVDGTIAPHKGLVNKMKASVIIPTKNAGALFADVLNAVMSQDTPWPYEVLVIDSGSQDDTVRLCKQTHGVRLHKIPAREFGHGKTRNLAISLTSGEFIIMLTHDAKPANRNWLRELVAAADQIPDVAGAFGRHLPYPGHSPFITRDLKLHFDNFANGPPIVRMEDAARYETDPGYRQFLHFFSDNNACLRRSVWERIPYPDVDFAEDQIWAKLIIEAGYAKAYADRACVFHSHDYGAWETLRRSFDESRALHHIFGYRLCPSLAHLSIQSLRCSMRDYRYLFANRNLRVSLDWLFKIPTHQLARQIGHYLGGRADMADNNVLTCLSLDQSRKKQSSC